MKKIVLNIRQVVGDFKARIGDAAMMEKYSLSPRSLINLKKELLGRGLIAPEDIKPSRKAPVSDRKALKAKAFVHDFRERPDDEYLMEKYGLTTAELRTVYRKLIEKRWISEYEFYMREGIVPEIGEPTTSLSTYSDEAGLTRTTNAAASPMSQSRDSGLPQDFFRDHSGIRIGTTTRAEELYHEEATGTARYALRSVRDTPTVVQLVTTELCPNCSRPKDDPSAESCAFCGIVFAKLKRRSQKGPVIWSDGYPEKE
jgi:hypothetical protein